VQLGTRVVSTHGRTRQEQGDEGVSIVGRSEPHTRIVLLGDVDEDGKFPIRVRGVDQGEPHKKEVVCGRYKQSERSRYHSKSVKGTSSRR
jgi:hypothetical protein